MWSVCELRSSYIECSVNIQYIVRLSVQCSFSASRHYLVLDYLFLVQLLRERGGIILASNLSLSLSLTHPPSLPPSLPPSPPPPSPPPPPLSLSLSLSLSQSGLREKLAGLKRKGQTDWLERMDVIPQAVPTLHSAGEEGEEEGKGGAGGARPDPNDDLKREMWL